MAEKSYAPVFCEERIKLVKVVGTSVPKKMMLRIDTINGAIIVKEDVSGEDAIRVSSEDGQIFGTIRVEYFKSLVEEKAIVTDHEFFYIHPILFPAKLGKATTELNFVKQED